MDTDEHGCRQGKTTAWTTRLKALIGERIFHFRKPFPIRVYPCPSVVKTFFYCMDSVKPELFDWSAELRFGAFVGRAPGLKMSVGLHQKVIRFARR